MSTQPPYEPPAEPPDGPGSGYPPPPMGAGGRGPGYGHGGGRIDIGLALRYSWSQFGPNAGPLILCTVIVFAVQISAVVIGPAIGGGVGAVIRIVGSIVSLIMTRGLIRAGLSVVNGYRVDPAQVFKFDHIGGFVVASIILGLAQGLVSAVAVLVLGSVLGILAVIVIAAVLNTLFGFYGFPIVERDLDGVSGLRRSYDLTKPHFANVFLFWLVMGVVTLVGALACGVGLLVAIPITFVAQAHAYRQLSGAAVAP